MDSSSLIKLDISNVDQASQVLTSAFFEDSMLTQMFPDEKIRLKKAPYVFKTELKFGIKFGEVYATSNFEGISVWISPKYVDLKIFHMLRAGAAALPFKVGLKHLPRLMNSYDLSVIHKRLITFPHWYLLVIGVDPIYQKRGYGSEMIEFMLDKIDHLNLPCYLEVGKEENLAFYKRFGFKIRQVTDLKKMDLTIWSMLREKKDK